MEDIEEIGGYTVGSDGVNRRSNGVLVIGLAPTIKLHAAREHELSNGTIVPIGPKTPILVMAPISISSADLIEHLMRENDAGRAVELVGYVVVKPTDLEGRISLTEEGEDAAEDH